MSLLQSNVEHRNNNGPQGANGNEQHQSYNQGGAADGARSFDAGSVGEFPTESPREALAGRPKVEDPNVQNALYVGELDWVSLGRNLEDKGAITNAFFVCSGCRMRICGGLLDKLASPSPSQM